MPSLRVLCVVLLAAVGAASGVFADTSEPESSSQVRAATPSASPQTRTTTQHAGRSNTGGFDVRAENALPGVQNWRISGTRGTAAGLGAYADAVSVVPGDRVALHVSGSGRIRVRALRIGWYGGAGARQVWESTFDAAPADQQDPASWPTLGSVETANWPPGQYLLRLDLGSASRYIPLTVTSPQLAGQVLLVTSPLTWQAENGPTPAGQLARSFDRPYAQAYGAGGFLAGDASIIQLAERDGRHLAYTTDLDLALDPASMDGARAVVFGSGSTFWPAQLRTAVIAAVQDGTNAAFFGAGTGTRRAELSSDGRSMTLESSVPEPTTALTGLRPVCTPAPATIPAAGSSVRGGAPWVVQDPAWWGYADAGVSAGQALPGLVSAEPDGVPAADQPRSGTTVTVLARSAVSCPAGTAGGDHAAQYWTDPSGAGVFSTGTSRWACVAGGSCGVSTKGVPVATRSMAAQVTRNVLVALAHPRAGRLYPAG